MPNLLTKWSEFYNSPTGRRVVNWGVTTVGVLLTSGVIPLDTPIGPFSFGQLLTVLGLRMPSHSIKGPVEVAPSIKGT